MVGISCQFSGRMGLAPSGPMGPDGLEDLTLKFDAQEIVAAIGAVTDGECLVLEVTGNLKDGTPIQGEDVVVILKKGKQGNYSKKGKKGKK